LNGKTMKGTVEAFLPFAILLTIFILGFITLRPFIPAIVWALVLSIALAPLHERIETAVWGNRKLATALIAVLMIVVLLLPIVGLSRAILAFVPEALAWLETLSEAALRERITVPDGSSFWQGDLAAIWNTIVADLAIIQRHTDSDFRPLLLWLVEESRLLGAFVLEFALGIILAALIINQKHQIATALERLFGRLAGGSGRPVAATAIVTIRSTVYGILGAAAAQTLAASVIYIVSGVPHWMMLSFLTFILAMVMVGPILVWAPIAVWLLIDGHVMLGLFVVFWGLVVVGLTDNLVRSVAVARTSDLPASLAFLGAIGGLLAWGVLGVFLGPVIVALCRHLILEWVRESRDVSEAA
jgi:predicted PurR-regulated permease PerM